MLSSSCIGCSSVHAGLSVPAFVVCASSAMNTDKFGGTWRSSCSRVLLAAAQVAIDSLVNSGRLNIFTMLSLSCIGGCSGACRPICASILCLYIFCQEYRQIGWNPAFLLQPRSSCSSPSCHLLTWQFWKIQHFAMLNSSCVGGCSL